MVRKLVTNGIRKDPQNGDILIGGGLKWVVALALSIMGYIAGNYIPVRTAATQIQGATLSTRLQAHIERDDRETARISSDLRHHIEISDARWEKVLVTLGSIDARFALVEASCRERS